MNFTIAYIAEPIEIEDFDEPIELLDNTFIKKANYEQIRFYRGRFKEISRFRDVQVPYEFSFSIFQKSPNRTKYLREVIPFGQWRYWVIENRSEPSGKAQKSLHDIELIFMLLRNPVHIAMEGAASKPDIPRIYSPIQNHISRRFNTPDWIDRKIPKYSISDMGECRDNLKRLRGLGPDYAFIKQALENFLQLNTIPQRHSLYFMGLFSIIESLIVRNPNKNDPISSITFQLTQKTQLLQNRYIGDFSFESFFQKANPKTIWSNLYGFRSEIAHGKNIDESPHSSLKSNENIEKFLRETITNIILVGLNEPRLLSDLKNC